MIQVFHHPGRRSLHGIYSAVAAVLSLAVVVAALVAVLGPRWPQSTATSEAPALPIMVGGLVFNIPPAAIRVAQQRRAGTQDRIDLAFLWPALVPPDPRARPAVSEDPEVFDRLFVTIAAAEGTLAIEDRIKTIYPRYFDFGRFTGPDGLVVIRFREDTPYQSEDLFYDPASPDPFIVRCTRPDAGRTPGTCLLERRVGGSAEITIRFPRDWLGEWRVLAAGIDRLLAGLRHEK